MLLSKRRLLRRLSLALLILAAALSLSGCSLGIFDQVIPKEPVRLQNETGTSFTFLGVYWEGHLLLHKASEDDVRQAVFPGKLLEGVSSLRMVGITREQQVYVSEPEAIKDKSNLVFKGAQPVMNQAIPFLQGVPALNTWETARTGGQVSAVFRADTPLHYQVFVLGRGTVLAPSAWGTQDAPVTVSWEENRGMTQSWLLLKTE